jgi:hypothetical protein
VHWAAAFTHNIHAAAAGTIRKPIAHHRQPDHLDGIGGFSQMTSCDSSANSPIRAEDPQVTSQIVRWLTLDAGRITTG